MGRRLGRWEEGGYSLLSFSSGGGRGQAETDGKNLVVVNEGPDQTDRRMEAGGSPLYL